MKLACQILHGHFGPVYLSQVSKNDDEELCFLKKFGFRGAFPKPSEKMSALLQFGYVFAYFLFH